ncbi:MAG: PIN domain-containing protein [Thermoleophilaceae bacterium]
MTSPRERRWRAWKGELVVSAFVAAEADYLILSRLGVEVQTAFVEDLASAYRVDLLDPPGLIRAAETCRQYRDLELGLADASIVVLADNWSTHSLASFDERDFRVVTALDGNPFELFPVA